MVAACCISKGQQSCGECSLCTLKQQILDEFNALDIANMPKVEKLYTLSGRFINLPYLLPSGQTMLMWDDSRVLLGSQLPNMANPERCFGLAADENFLVVSEYGENGIDPQLVMIKCRR